MKRRIARFLRPTFNGLVVGTIFYCFALTPSLLPRPPLFAGAIAGISFGIGYGLGTALSWLFRHFVHKEPAEHIKRIAWYCLAILMVLCMVAYSVWNASWENQVRVFIGRTDFDGRHISAVIGMAVLAAMLVIVSGKAIGSAIRRINTFVNRWVPPLAGFAVAIVAVGAAGLLLYDGVITRAFVRTSNKMYSRVNDTTAKGVVKPTSTLRSGGTTSLIPWQSLGYQGRSFVAGGPNRAQIAAFDKRPAEQPIRVYVGLESASNTDARAALAVKELERTGAFDRPVLVVMGTTGTGWIEPQSADSLEYMWDGNTAIVAAQYSYLPSWISFLVDQQKASNAGRALFNAVYAKWKTLPADHRPKLISYGLSLGSFGAQAAFTNSADISRRTDGALYMGTPNFTPLWQTSKNHRDAGTPEWRPVYQKGKTMRFAATYRDIAKQSPAAWAPPRVLYMQHASDPIVWWNYSLLWHKPDWLKEARGPDVSPNMQWYPFVTFAQVTVDEFFGTSVPAGHGHNYSNTVVAAWAAVTQPPEWTSVQAAKLQTAINAYPID